MDLRENEIQGSLGALSVVNEPERANKFISSILFSRATIFHPSARLTPSMAAKQQTHGNGDPNKPLESVHINSYGKPLRVDVHIRYLLQPHRDILETMLAYAQTIRLDDPSYRNPNTQFCWSQIVSTLSDGSPSNSQSDGFDSIIDRGATVLSMSMYELATRMGMAQTRANYDQIEQRIIQLKASQLLINELDNNGGIIDKRPLSFVHDFRFYCDKSKNKNKAAKGNHTNHVFLIPDVRLLQAIKDHGYYYRQEQQKMSHYSKPSIRSFLKWLTTHKGTFLDRKKLEWAIQEYIKSIASPVNRTFKYDLKKAILSQATQIESDFNLQISDNGKGSQIFYVGIK